jgi:hypothetical protein
MSAPSSRVQLAIGLTQARPVRGHPRYNSKISVVAWRLAGGLEERKPKIAAGINGAAG